MNQDIEAFSASIKDAFALRVAWKTRHKPRLQSRLGYRISPHWIDDFGAPVDDVREVLYVIREKFDTLPDKAINVDLWWLRGHEAAVLRVEDWWVVIRLITHHSSSVARHLTIDLTDRTPRLSTSWSIEDENVAADLHYQARLRWKLANLNRGDMVRFTKDLIETLCDNQNTLRVVQLLNLHAALSWALANDQSQVTHYCELMNWLCPASECWRVETWMYPRKSDNHGNEYSAVEASLSLDGVPDSLDTMKVEYTDQSRPITFYATGRGTGLNVTKEGFEAIDVARVVKAWHQLSS